VNEDHPRNNLKHTILPLVDFEAVNSYGFLFFGNQPVHRGSSQAGVQTP